MDTLLSIFSPGFNYSDILKVVLIYFVFLWIVICIWIFTDSLKRYKNKIIPIMFLLLILPVNIPFLLFYLIIRPEREDDNILYLKDSDSLSFKGANIPVVNFVGDNGVEMSLLIKIAKKPDNLPDMAINVDWLSEKANLERKNSEVANSDNKSEKVRDNYLTKVGSRVKSLVKKIPSVIKIKRGQIKSDPKDSVTLENPDQKIVENKDIALSTEVEK